MCITAEAVGSVKEDDLPSSGEDWSLGKGTCSPARNSKQALELFSESMSCLTGLTEIPVDNDLE